MFLEDCNRYGYSIDGVSIDIYIENKQCIKDMFDNLEEKISEKVNWIKM